MTACALPPIVGAEIWRTVMDAASQGQDAPRCQCEGACGQPHTKSGYRCPRMHGKYVRGGTVKLSAAPADLSTDVHTAVTLPPSALRAWCPSCFDGARREANRKNEAAATVAVMDMMEGLF